MQYLHERLEMDKDARFVVKFNSRQLARIHGSQNVYQLHTLLSISRR